MYIVWIFTKRQYWEKITGQETEYMKKLWITIALFVAIETFAFPQILFPDCIGEYKKNTYTWGKESVEYHFQSFIYEYLSKMYKNK